MGFANQTLRAACRKCVAGGCVGGWQRNEFLFQGGVWLAGAVQELQEFACALLPVSQTILPFAEAFAMPVVENSENPVCKVVGTLRVPVPAHGVCGLQCAGSSPFGRPRMAVKSGASGCVSRDSARSTASCNSA